MSVVKFKPEGIKTLDVKWNNGILRVTHDALLKIFEDRGELTFFVHEPELDEEFVLAEIQLNVKPNKMDESQRDMFYWILENYDGVYITKNNQLEESFDVLVDQLRKLGLVE